MEPAHESALPPASPTVAAAERLNYAYLLIIGVAMGVIAPFTLLAWPLAIVVGMIIGLANVERSRGIDQRAAVHMLRALAVVGGIIGMLILGALFGGLIALLIVALAAFAERVTANTGPTGQTVARILLFIITFGIWVVLALVLRLNVNINIGG